MAHVAKWKDEVYRELVDALVKNPVVGIVNIGGIPSPQMQLMRRGLRGKALLVTSKNSLITLAIKEAAKQRKGLESLLPIDSQQTALVATKLNPFRLYKELESTKTKAPARGGEKAPDNIEIKRGDTPFKPGPIVGEMQKIGISAAIEGGKVIIKKDTMLVKKGDVISREQATMMARLDILPLIVGLDLKLVYEEGLVYKRDALAFDDVKMMDDMRRAAFESMALALEISYMVKDTIKPLIARAFRNAMAVSLESGIPTKDNIKLLLARAGAQAGALSAKTNVSG
jgi:large subunit ribosomal protein L10